MLAALARRGPDASGRWTQGPCALGHRRLSIIDLSPEATQPMVNETGDVAIAVNGEIYNFAALREELVARGHTFRSRSDSETALHLYEEHGEEFASRLDGMFAILLYDARRRCLVAARDRSGKKPLYYRVLPHGVAFASEVGALITSFPDVRPEPDLGAIDHYLTLQYVPSPRTAYRGTFKVEAAHVERFVPGDAGPRQRTRYWTKPGGTVTGSEREVEEELLRRLRAAVRKRLVSDVPLGAFLSGGLDSSLVVALMAEASTRPVKTFSIGFPHAGDSELHYARLIAKRFATDHHEEVVTLDVADLSALVETVRHHGQPFGDSSAIATYYLAKMTREHVTVALSGDGSDECFAGYKRYATARVGHLARSRLARGTRSDAWRRHPRGTAGRKWSSSLRSPRMATTLRLPEGERYMRLVGRSWATKLQERALPRAHAGRERARSLVRRPPRGQRRELRDGSHLRSRLPDVSRGRHQPEGGHRFHDARARGALSVPRHGRHRARRAAAGAHARPRSRQARSPRSARRAGCCRRGCTVARSQAGFAPGGPLERWMRRDLREMTRDVLFDRRCRERGLFDARAVERLVRDMEAGRGSADHVWTLLVLELWFRELVDH